MLTKYDKADLKKGQLEVTGWVTDITARIHTETASDRVSVISVFLSAPAQKSEKWPTCLHYIQAQQKRRLADVNMYNKTKMQGLNLQFDAGLLARAKLISIEHNQREYRRFLVTGDLHTDIFARACRNPLTSSFLEPSAARLQAALSD